MTKTIKDIMGLRPAFDMSEGTDFVGIEVEYEYRNLEEAPSIAGWTVHSDGSLRGGYEFVTNPVLIGSKHYSRCLKNLKEYIKDQRDNILDSERTGTHVHFNVMHLTLQQFFNTMFHLYLFEDLLISTQSSKRKDNSFCLSFSNTDNIYERWYSALSHDDFNIKRLLSNAKYYATNFDSTGTHGTIELRIFDTCFNVDKLDREIRTVSNIMDAYKNTSIRSTISLIDSYGLNSLNSYLNKNSLDTLLSGKTESQVIDMLSVNNIPLIDLDRKWENTKK